MHILRLVATRMPEFDPAYFAFERLVPFGASNVSELLLRLHGAEVHLMAVNGHRRTTLARLDVPAGEAETDAARLSRSAGLTEFLSDFINEQRVDVVHAVSFNLVGQLRRLSSVGVGRVLSARGLDVMRGILLWHTNAAESLGSIVLHCPSLELAGKCAALDIAGTIAFVPNGVADDVWMQVEPARNGRVVLVPGHVGLERGLFELVDLLSAVLQAGEVVFVAGSRGFLLSDAELVERCGRLKSSFDLKLYGPSPRAELLSVLPSATVAVCPGGREGGQSTILECIACGVPVMTDDNDTNRVLFGDGPGLSGAFSLIAADSLRRVLDEPARRNALLAAQRRTVRTTLTAGHEHDRLMRLYQTAIA